MAELGDLRTGEGLREALRRLPAEGGWSGPLGRRVLIAVGDLCGRLAVSVERRVEGCYHDPDRAADLTARAWELLTTSREVIIGAANPWAYLTRSVLRAGVNAGVGDRLLVRDVVVRGGGARSVLPPIRVGDEVRALDRCPGPYDPPASPPLGESRHADSSLAALVEVLVAAGAQERVTWAAIDRIADVVSMHRHGRREAAVTSDRVLAELGLSSEQSSALLALLTGTRRGGVEQSLWLRLRKQPRDERGRYAATVTPAVRARIQRYASGFGSHLDRAG